MKGVMCCSHPQISLGRSIKENEVDRTCGTCGRGDESLRGFDGKARRKVTTRKTEA
jgi:hypothetical protein